MSEIPPAHSLPEQAFLSFERSAGGASCIARQHVRYPFHVGRNLCLPGDPAGMAAVYIQSCSGGLFAGEDLGMRLHAASNAIAHVSSGAATVAHRMVEAPARQRLLLEAEPGALLEYLPLANILFPGARVCTQVKVVLHPGARIMLCDSFQTHTPQGEVGSFDWYRADLDIHDAGGRLLASDRLHVEGPAFLRGLPGITRGIGMVGTFVMLGQEVPPIQALRSALNSVEGLYAGVSALPNGCGLFARLGARRAPELRSGMHTAWATMRSELTGNAPVKRRR